MEWHILYGIYFKESECYFRVTEYKVHKKEVRRGGNWDHLQSLWLAFSRFNLNSTTTEYVQQTITSGKERYYYSKKVSKNYGTLTVESERRIEHVLLANGEWKNEVRQKCYKKRIY